ncbi:MAG: hypothetical protein HXY38_01580 [Chloroflexi bacterium]|nr:hypothetical protein [Chloroflexota bacterium]
MKRGVNMNKKYRFLLIVAAVFAMLVSACGGTATETSAGGNKPRASLVEFTGVIEAMDGNQWTINGQVFTITDDLLDDDSFVVGDTIEVKAEVQADGSVVVTNVSQPGSADDNSNDDNGNDDNSNADNGNDDNSNDDNGNDDNSNDGNGNDDNSTDDNGNDDNSNDDNGNDDNSGSGDDDDNSGSGGDDDNDDNSGSGDGDDD